MKRVVVANDVIAQETKRLIDMGREVTIPVKGNSMLPFIHGNKDLAVLQQISSPLNKWDMVLAFDSRGVLVLHRIIQINGDTLTLMGDGNLKGVETCSVSDVIARLEYVERAEKRWNCNTRSARMKAVLWYHLRPVRRYLLAIYRRVTLQNK